MLDRELEPSSFSSISVVGLGYIGLPTAAILASRKIPVIGVDINEKTVDTINLGKVHIVEPDLDIVVQAAVAQGYLKATTEAQPADAFLIAVPTPFTEGYQPDLSYIKAACELIASVLKKDDLIILESTSPVGTAEQMANWLSELRSDLTFPPQKGELSDIRLAYCPERVLPGRILRELVQNDRVIGGLTPKCSLMAAELYKIFVEGECILTNARTAEMCKLTENSFRDVNIAFANELSIICDTIGVNVWELIDLANHHPRVSILKPGPGVGGHCLAVDPWFIVSSAPEQAKLIRTAREVNDSKPEWVLEKIKTALADYLLENPTKTVKDITIACFGLTFKADIDDLRESPALKIVEEIARIHPGFVTVIEPHVNSLPSSIIGQVELKSIEDAFFEADIIVMLVSHKKFIGMKDKIRVGTRIIDSCGIWVS